MSAAFAPIAIRSTFEPLPSVGSAPGSAADGMQPLPVSHSAAPGRRERLRAIGTGGLGSSEGAAEPAGPSQEDLDLSERGRQLAEQKLAETQVRLAELEQQLGEQTRGAAAVARALHDARQTCLTEIRGSFAELVLSATRSLVGEAFSGAEGVFSARLQAVAEQLVLEEDVLLLVAPANEQAAREAIAGLSGWRIEVDQEMDDGCIARCRNSVLDARLATAFDGLEDAARDWLANDFQREPGR